MRVVHGFIAGVSSVLLVISVLQLEVFLSLGWFFLLAAHFQPALDGERTTAFTILSILAVIMFAISLSF